MSASTCSSPSQKVADEFRKRFGDDQVKTFQVKPLYVKEVTAFIKRVETAHQAATKSRLVFK